VANPPRRIVTGHTIEGVSVVLTDAPVPVTRHLPDSRVYFHEVWNTEAAPALVTAEPSEEPTHRDITVPPPPRGTKIRYCDFEPDGLDSEGRQSPFHRTASVDYGIVLEGEITLILDDSEVTARAGDVIIQRGTDHAWANRGHVTARVVFVLVDGEFDAALTDSLAPGAVDSLMLGGPDA